MVPGDTDDIKREYEVLLNELRKFNPELCDKHRVLAVTKCDLLDDELIEMLKEELKTPSNSPCLGGEQKSSLNREDLGGSIPVVFISAVTGFGLDELKDVLWAEMNAESNKLAAITTTESIAHRDKDMTRFQAEMADEGEDDDIEFVDADDIEDLEDFEYEEESD